MDKGIIELVIANLQKNSDGVGLFSKEYLFHKKYAKHRSTIVMLGRPISHRSRLSILLREGMTNERRAIIFPGNYDLGNMQTVPAELCTYGKLAEELFGGTRNGIVVNDLFETLKKGIYKITKRKAHEHFSVNKSTALKVLKTLHLLMTERDSSLIQLISSPPSPNRFSMSFRDAYPYFKNEEQVWLIADLKAYLSVELSDDRIQEICQTHDDLREWMNSVLKEVEQVMFRAYRLDSVSMVSAYSDLIEAVEKFEFTVELNDVPLDETLFSHLHGLEDAHFYAGYSQVVKAGIPQITVIPVSKELRKLCTTIFRGKMNIVHETNPLIPLRDLTEFSQRWQAEVIAIIEKAMCEHLEVEKFQKITVDSGKLLGMLLWFGKIAGRAFQDDSIRVSIVDITAAFCCIWYSLNDSTNFKPYWLGQFSQGGSLNASNKTPIFPIGSLIDDIPEEHRHIWAYRFEWFANAIRGHSKLNEKKFGFRSAMANKVLEICSMSNINCISKAQIDFDKSIKTHTRKHYKND